MFGLCSNDFDEWEDIIERVAEIWFPDKKDESHETCTIKSQNDDELPF